MEVAISLERNSPRSYGPWSRMILGILILSSGQMAEHGPVEIVDLSNLSIKIGDFP